MGLVFFEGMLWSSMKKLLFMVCPNHVLLCFVSYQLWCLVVVWWFGLVVVLLVIMFVM